MEKMKIRAERFKVELSAVGDEMKRSGLTVAPHCDPDDCPRKGFSTPKAKRREEKGGGGERRAASRDTDFPIDSV